MYNAHTPRYLRRWCESAHHHKSFQIMWQFLYSYIWSVGKAPIAMFESTTWHASFTDFFIKLWCYTVIGKQQLLFSIDRNRFHWVIIRMGPAPICLKISAWIAQIWDLSNATTFNPPLSYWTTSGIWPRCRTSLFGLIAMPNGRGAARPLPIAAALLHIHQPKNINLLFPETISSFRPELGPPGSNILPLDHRGFEI
jgi:hypothetical protein